MATTRWTRRLANAGSLRVPAVLTALAVICTNSACGGSGGGGRPTEPHTIWLTSAVPMYSVQTGTLGSATAGPAEVVGSFQSVSGGTEAVFSFDLGLLPAGARVVSAEVHMPVTRVTEDPGLLDFLAPCSLDHDGRNTHLLEEDEAGFLDLDFASERLATLGLPTPQPGKPPQWSVRVDASIDLDVTAGLQYAVFRVTIDPHFVPEDIWFVDYEIGGAWSFNGIAYPPSLRVTYELP